MRLKEQYILRKIRKGDLAAFEDLFHTNYPGMCSYSESLVKREDVAEEIVQDVFLNIWKNRENLRIVTSLHNYLYRSVFNNSMMYLRKSQKESRLDMRWAEETQQGEDPGEEMNARELNALIIYTLEGLPERTREIFSMSRFEGLKYEEIAGKLSISVKTVEANMGKALKALRDSVEEYKKSA